MNFRPSLYILHLLTYALPEQRYVNEHDAVREVLMALQGRKNIMIVSSEDDKQQFCFTVSFPFDNPRDLSLFRVVFPLVVSNCPSTSPPYIIFTSIHSILLRANSYSPSPPPHIRQCCLLEGIRTTTLR